MDTITSLSYNDLFVLRWFHSITEIIHLVYVYKRYFLLYICFFSLGHVTAVLMIIDPKSRHSVY